MKFTLDNNNHINDFFHYSRLKPIKTINNDNNDHKKKQKIKLKLKIGEQDSRNSTFNENIYFSTYKKISIREKMFHH